MTAFDTTPEYLHQTADQTNKGAIDIDIGLSNLQTYCRSLDGPWLGPASQSFQFLMQQFQTHAKNLNTALVEIAAQLHRNAADYEEGEHVNNLQMINLAGSLPTVNL